MDMLNQDFSDIRKTMQILNSSKKSWNYKKPIKIGLQEGSEEASLSVTLKEEGIDFPSQITRIREANIKTKHFPIQILILKDRIFVN